VLGRVRHRAQRPDEQRPDEQRLGRKRCGMCHQGLLAYGSRQWMSWRENRSHC
jgi:hypothetical protein